MKMTGSKWQVIYLNVDSCPQKSHKRWVPYKLYAYRTGTEDIIYDRVIMYFTSAFIFKTTYGKCCADIIFTYHLLLLYFYAGKCHSHMYIYMRKRKLHTLNRAYIYVYAFFMVSDEYLFPSHFIPHNIYSPSLMFPLFLFKFHRCVGVLSWANVYSCA